MTNLSRRALPEAPKTFGLFIDGLWESAGDRALSTRIAPGYGLPVTRIPLCSVEDVNRAVAAARRVFRAGLWSRCDGASRAAVLRRMAEGIRSAAAELAYWETLESGKPISQSLGEMEGAAQNFDLAAGLALTLHGESANHLGEAMLGLVTRQPVGVVGLITPWNFPMIVLAERLPYILASGNSVVVKPAEITSATTLMLADIAQAAGLPAGVYNVVPGTGREVGQAISAHRDIDMVSFTGSTATGALVLQASTSNFKKVGLELGGKNPQIVFADADLEDAADGVAFAMCFNAGQCCVSGSRLIVEASVADQFLDLLQDRLARVRIGDCLDPESQMGAIATPEHCTKILDYIALGEAEGATLAFGGQRRDAPGWFIEPTILTGTLNGMRVASEEIFGPVLCVMTFRTPKEALQMANDSIYGLAASIWTKDIDKALTLMRGVEAGRTWVNTTIAGGPGQPMGGFKQSGIGREAGMLGVEEYTEVKSVHIAIGKRSPWVR